MWSPMSWWNIPPVGGERRSGDARHTPSIRLSWISKPSRAEASDGGGSPLSWTENGDRPKCHKRQDRPEHSSRIGLVFRLGKGVASPKQPKIPEHLRFSP
jgi:hypothetical protein